MLLQEQRGSFMLELAFRDLLQYGDYLLEIAVLGVVVYRGLWKRFLGVSSYLVFLISVDAIFRTTVFYAYGITSRQYWYTYWLSNVGLQLAAFLLVCYFFRSACAQQPNWWQVLRLALPLVFLLTVALSAVSIWRNYSELRLDSVSELEQYLYFVCLILNTLLFIMMQYTELADDRLPMLVCGLGLQFAGPAAGMALLVLTHQSAQAKTLAGYIEQLCTLGMLLTWMHAVKRTPSRRKATEEGMAAQSVAA